MIKLFYKNVSLHIITIDPQSFSQLISYCLEPFLTHRGVISPKAWLKARVTITAHLDVDVGPPCATFFSDADVGLNKNKNNKAQQPKSGNNYQQQRRPTDRAKR